MARRAQASSQASRWYKKRPANAGTAFAWDTRSNFTPPGTDTEFLYLYEVDPFDPLPPSISNVSILSNNSSTTLAKVDDSVTLNFDADEALQTPAVTIGGHTASVATTTGNGFTASTTMQVGDTEGTIAFSIAYSDLAGNAGFTTSTTTDNSSVTFYVELPPLAIPPAPTAATSGGGSQPVGSSPTAPGFQTQNDAIPAVSIDQAQKTVIPTPPPAPESAAVKPAAGTAVHTVQKISRTVADKMPIVVSQVYEQENVAAVAQSGFEMPWWIWFVFAGLITIVSGMLIWRWTIYPAR
ncbi:MAG: hypothetical protein V4474_03810 [Patescibacteria group bacterium]